MFQKDLTQLLTITEWTQSLMETHSYFDKPRLKLLFQSLYRFSVPYVVTPNYLRAHIILWMIMRAKTWRVDINISTNVIEQNVSSLGNQVHPYSRTSPHDFNTAQLSFPLPKGSRSVGWLGFGVNCTICSPGPTHNGVFKQAMARLSDSCLPSELPRKPLAVSAFQVRGWKTPVLGARGSESSMWSQRGHSELQVTRDGVYALKVMVVGQGPCDLGMPCLLLVLGIGETSASEGNIPVSVTTIFLRFTESSRHLLDRL